MLSGKQRSLRDTISRAARWTANEWGAVIALIALFVAVNQACQTRAQNRISVRPLLRVGQMFIPGQEMGLTLENQGLGPAVVSSVQLFVDGSEVEGDDVMKWSVAIERLAGQVPNLRDVGDIASVVPTPHTILPAGGRLALYRVRPEATTAQTAAVLQLAFSHLTIKIRYKSLYGETLIGGIGAIRVRPWEWLWYWRDNP